MASKSRYTPQQRDAAEGIRREVVEQMHQDLAAKLTSFDDRDAWQQWLKFASGFHQYSFSNTCLIYMAKPDATLVAGYRAWQAKGHQVRHGETAIKVFAPVTRTVPLEDANGKPVLDANGSQVTRRRMIGVKVASVFDASQVEPPPQVERPQPTLLVGQAPSGLWDSLAQLVTDEGFTVTRGDCGGASGYTDFATKQIRVRADVDESQAVKTLSHEAAHVFTMDPGDIAAYGTRQCRGILEVIAESVAYLVTQAHGLDAGQYTFNYVAGWAVEAAGTTQGVLSIDQVVRNTGECVIAAAHRILAHTQPATNPIVDATSADTVALSATQSAAWETVTSNICPRAEIIASPARPVGRQIAGPAR